MNKNLSRRHGRSIRLLASVSALLMGACAGGAQPSGSAPPSGGEVRLHYSDSGKGPVVLLLHGYAQTSLMWRPLIPELSKTHRVIAPDLRGAGGSDKPATGYDKRTLAQDVHKLVTSLGIRHATVVGHDIGLMVAYAYAAQFPDEVEKIVLMDAFLPGIGPWKDVWLLRDLWHFHFYGDVPLKLVEGRERIYFEHFWNDFAADPKRSVPEADRRAYAQAYAQAGGMRAGFEYFRNFEQDAADFDRFSKTKLTMPMLVLTGKKASGTFLIDQARLVATDVRGVVVKGSCHWLMDEAPGDVIPQLVDFIREPSGKTARPDSPNQRLTPAELENLGQTSEIAGTSGVAGIQTQVIKGDPTKPGIYTLLLRVPANTTIAAHSHPDDRVCTVISGVWNFGFGDRFDEGKLKRLPAGSFYTEPPNEPHFARTGESPAVVQVTGYGPTGTK